MGASQVVSLAPSRSRKVKNGLLRVGNCWVPLMTRNLKAVTEFSAATDSDVAAGEHLTA